MAAEPNSSARVAGQVARAAGAVLVINLASRILGFVRDMVIASTYGATPATDAYMVAYTLPYLLQSVLGMAFVMVMVPAVTAHLAAGRRQEAWHVASGIFNSMGLLLVAATLAGMFFATELVRLMAPGFTGEQVALAGELTRIMFPSLVLVGLGMLITGVLNACRVFALPAAAPALANVVVIGAVLLTTGTLQIYGLAWGTLVGFGAFLLVQLPALRGQGFTYTFTWGWEKPEVRQVLGALVPVALAVSINQLYLVVNRLLASHLDPGRITALDLANRVINLPVGIVAAALATAIFPLLAAQAARHEDGEMAATTSRGLGLVLFLSIPMAVGLMLLAEPVVRLLFGRGAFGPEATQLTAMALLYFAVGLPAMAAKMVITRAYYARGKAGVPLATGLFSVGLDIILSLFWLPSLGHGGLALANSLAATADVCLLVGLARRELPQMRLSPLFFSLLQTVLAALVMGVLVGAVKGAMPPPATALPLLVWLALIVLLGVIVFIAAARFFRIPELEFFLRWRKG